MLAALIPAPYGVLLRWLAIAGLVAAVWGHGYVHGLDHQQDADAVAQAKAQKAADDYNDKMRASLRQRATQYQQEKANVQAQRDDLQRALSAALGRLRNNATTAFGSHLSDFRPIAVDTAGAAAVDARFSEAVQHDASHYAGCVVQLNALIDTCKKAGCDNP